jgi:glycosyltransferase involved in cell wall biosynthesis
LHEHGCGWCVEATVENLAAAIREALSFSKTELAEMGAQGRQWMRRDFSWAQLAAQMIEVCEWTLSGGAAPSCVVLD